MLYLVVLLVLLSLVRAAPAPVPSVTSGCETGRRKDVFAFNVGGPSVPSLGFGGENLQYLVHSDEGSEVYTTKANVTMPPKCSMGVLYRSERFTRGSKLVYRFPMPEGMYVVTTFHAETFFESAGKRLFHIEINGARMRTNLDVYTDANGMNKGIKLRHHNIHSINGSVEIAFIKSKQNPQVNAIRFQGMGADKIATACGGTNTNINTDTSHTTTTEMNTGMHKSQPSQMMIPVITDPSPPAELQMMMTEAPSVMPEAGVDPMTPTAIPVIADPSPSSIPSPMVIEVESPSPMPTSTSTPIPTSTQTPSASSSASMTSTSSAEMTPPRTSTTETIMTKPVPPLTTTLTTSTSASGSGCSVGDYIFCEDFEGGTGPKTWTLENAAKVALAPARNGKRSKALYLNPAGGKNGRLNVDLQGVDGPILHGRVQLYVKEFATGPPFAHFVVVELSESGTFGTERIRPVGGQYVLNGTEKASVWGVGADAGPTGDWTQWRSSAPTKDMRWTCVEWRMQRSNSQIDVWIDGKLKPELTVDRDQHTGGHGKFVFPKFNKAWFGWWVFQGDTTPATFDVYIDDIALSTKRIGC